MSATLAITIDSGDYVQVDRLLRICREEFKPGISGYPAAILEARRRLGLSMDRYHVLYDYDPSIDESTFS